jgi:hypothetical protein
MERRKQEFFPANMPVHRTMMVSHGSRHLAFDGVGILAIMPRHWGAAS